MHACFCIIQQGTHCTIIASDLYATSYFLSTSITVVVFKSVHKIMINMYIGLYLTHADLQINIHVNIKFLPVNLLQGFIFYLLMHGYFSKGACDLCLYPISLCYLLKTCLECTSSTLDVLESTLLYFRCV